MPATPFFKGRDALPLSKPDLSGTVIAKSVKGWTVANAAGDDVLAAIDYGATPKELVSGDSESIHFILTAPQCLDLADALIRAARNVLRSRSTGTPSQ